MTTNIIYARFNYKDSVGQRKGLILFLIQLVTKLVYTCQIYIYIYIYIYLQCQKLTCQIVAKFKD